ncbi:MAG: hypothetical protein JWO05_2329 [Gemmatimonadetes bacterium]|nr:hypothetical protein [Gemmatimonadota bacterium]
MRAIRVAAVVVTVACSLSVSACHPAVGISTLSTPQRDWATSFSAAQRAASEGRLDRADQLLGDFAARNPRTSEAREALYWRALWHLQGETPAAGLATIGSMLDAYLAPGEPLLHRDEATALRRLATQVESLTRIQTSLERSSPAPVAGAAGATGAKDSKDQSAEIARLKDDLAKANEELERIKKRLASPRPPSAR